MTEMVKHLGSNQREESPGSINNINTEANDWGSLAELNPNQSSMTWDDLAAEANENKTDWISDELDQKEQIEASETGLEEPQPIKLTSAEIRKLNRFESGIYYSDPGTFAQLQQLKSRYGNSFNFQEFTESLAIHVRYHPAYLSARAGSPPAQPNHTQEKPLWPIDDLDRIAHIYDVVGNVSGSDTLFNKTPDDLKLISHCFDISLAEMPLEKETVIPRENLIEKILHKLHRNRYEKDRSERNQAMQEQHDIARRNDKRRSFLSGVVDTYTLSNLDADSLQNLAKITENSIKAGDDNLADIICRAVGHNDNRRTLRLATMAQEIGPDHPEQRSALESYFYHFGLDDENATKFREQVLPLLSDPETCETRSEILLSISRDNKPKQLEEKQEFALKELLPTITANNELTYAQKITYKHLLGYDTDQNTRKELLRDANEKIIPFLGSRPNVIKSFLANGIMDRDFDMLTNTNHQSSPQKSIDQYIAQSEELLSFIEDDPNDNYLLYEKLIKLAFNRDYETDFIEYLEADLFPRIAQNDPSLGSWTRGAGFLRGESKIRDFDFNCLASKITPHNINQLLMQRRELPTSDAGRLEQNRIDALAVEGIVIPNHSFIHYEDPMTHNLLTAMVNYYDTYGATSPSKAKQELNDIAKECSSTANGLYGQLEERIYDIDNYNKIIKGEVNDDFRFSRAYDIPAIDVLRRLAENTKLNDLEIPNIADKNWQKLMQDAGIRLNPNARGDKMYSDWNNVGKLVKYTNDWLLEHQDQYGLDASILAAIGFTERAATFALRNISEKERRELPYDNEFKEIVKLQELTASYDHFHPQDFERFWEGFKNIKLDDEKALQDHYWRLARRELTQVAKLQHAYKEENKKDAGMILQSGNLLAELIQLIDHREPKTLRERADRRISDYSH